MTDTSVTLDSICVPSEEIVAREIEGEILIVPLVAGIGDADDELYSLNETGHAIWRRLDGSTTLGQIARALATEFEAPPETITADVLGLMGELARRRMITVR